MSVDINSIKVDNIIHNIQSFSEKVEISTENECFPPNGTSKIYQVSNCSCGVSSGYILATSWSSGTFITQLFMQADTGKVLAIRYYNGSWTSWSKLLNSDTAYTKDQINQKITSNPGPKGADGKSYWETSQWIDLSGTSYNVNTYYPVYGTSIPKNGVNNLKVSVQLNSGTVPSWSTHQNGFSCDLEVADQAYNGATTAGDTKIIIDNYRFADKNPVSYDQMENAEPVFYLRGGGKYKLFATYACTWTIVTTSFTSHGDTIKPLASRPAPKGTTYKGDRGDTGPNKIDSNTSVSGFSNGDILYNNNGKVGSYKVTTTVADSVKYKDSSIPASSVISEMNTTLSGKAHKDEINTFIGIAYKGGNECNLSKGFGGGNMYLNWRGCTNPITMYHMCSGMQNYAEAPVHADDFQVSIPNSDGTNKEVSLKDVKQSAMKVRVSGSTVFIENI